MPAIFRSEPGPRPPLPQQVVAIVNPVGSRAASAVSALRDAADRLGIAQPRIVKTTRREPGGPQALHAANSGADLIVVVGGDGTVRHVAGAIADRDVPLGILPAGSGNVLANNLGIKPRAMGAAAVTALNGVLGDVDLGWATVSVDGQDREPEPFTAMAGIGRDAEAVVDTQTRIKDRLGAAAYAEAGVRHALATSLPMRVQLDDGPIEELDTWTVLVANTPRVPGRITLFPDACVDDGELSVMTVKLRSPLDWLPIAAEGLGLHNKLAPLDRTTAKRVTVIPHQPCAAHIDGDDIRNVEKMVVTIAPAALKVRVAR